MIKLRNRWTILLSVLVFFSVSVMANNTEAFMAPLVSQSLLLDIEKKPNNSLVAVGERGHILLSTDGKQWQQTPVPTQATLTAVNFIDNDHGWVVGHDATILATVDGGQSWQIQQQLPELQKPLMAVRFFDLQHGIAVGSYGLFFRTRDGGLNWQKELHAEILLEDDQLYLDDLKQEDQSLYLDELSSILPHFNSLSTLVNGQLYLVGEAGLVAVSDNLGISWQRQELDYYGSFFSVNQTDDVVVAAGLRGSVYMLVDARWQKIPVANKSSINSVINLGQQLLLVANNGVYFTLSSNLNIDTKQTDEGQAILDAAVMSDQIVTVTVDGIGYLQR
ncbi:YCF48-related protein [Alteromonadaceae bacterium BrNp21-10]|nr:YCF48-related protein [Alteromonadaceae bacterium BrNp21-10]